MSSWMTVFSPGRHCGLAPTVKRVPTAKTTSAPGTTWRVAAALRARWGRAGEGGGAPARPIEQRRLEELHLVDGGQHVRRHFDLDGPRPARVQLAERLVHEARPPGRRHRPAPPPRHGGEGARRGR